MRLTAAAALRYPSSSVGESACTSEMLSKLALFWSSGSQSPAFTCRPSRSRTTRSYSARLSRWNDRVPGLTGAASMVDSSVSTRASSVSPPGRFDPGGGIISARSLRIIFSVASLCVAVAML